MATADSGREAYTAIAWVSSRNYVARLAGLNLAFQLEEAPIGAVETLRQDRCNVKERGRVPRRRETATLSPHVLRRVRLIQKHGEFAEDGTGLRHPKIDLGGRRTEGHTSLGSFTNGNHGFFTTSLVQSMVSTPT